MKTPRFVRRGIAAFAAAVLVSQGMGMLFAAEKAEPKPGEDAVSLQHYRQFIKAAEAAEQAGNYEEAKGWLNRAMNSRPPSERITIDVKNLQARVEQGGVKGPPVEVTLRSDGQTWVSIEKHVVPHQSPTGRPVKLPAGHYTAIGRRKGYRDIEIQFEAKAGQPSQVVTVICNEKMP